MAKLAIILCLTLVISFVAAQGSEEEPECGPGGWICRTNSDCCPGLICNKWAGRCTKPKTTTAAPTTPEASTAAPSTAAPEPSEAAPPAEGQP